MASFLMTPASFPDLDFQSSAQAAPVAAQFTKAGMTSNAISFIGTDLIFTSRVQIGEGQRGRALSLVFFVKSIVTRTGERDGRRLKSSA